jgi:multidrug resistance efflux pump
MGEPSLNDIDDFSNKESKGKHNLVLFIVFTLLLASAILSYLQFQNEQTPSTFEHIVVKEVK